MKEYQSAILNIYSISNKDIIATSMMDAADAPSVYGYEVGSQLAPGRRGYSEDETDF